MRANKIFFSCVIFLSIPYFFGGSSTQAAVKIMPLGDSITQGQSSGEPDTDRQISYRKALWDKLISGDYDVDFVGSLNSGSDILGFEAADHEGHNGFTADQIRDEVFDWLQLNFPDVVLLHVGTNDISGPQPVPDIVSEVEDILDEIFIYSPEMTVILARIINRVTFSQKTNDFNNLLPGMVNGHPYKNRIKIVDMEVGAGMDYRIWPTGDMNDDIHPYQDPVSSETPGYDKMADVWFSALQQVLPDPNPPPPDDPPSSSGGGGGGGCFISAAGEDFL